MIPYEIINKIFCFNIHPVAEIMKPLIKLNNDFVKRNKRRLVLSNVTGLNPWGWQPIVIDSGNWYELEILGRRCKCGKINVPKNYFTKHYCEKKEPSWINAVTPSEIEF